MTGEGTPTAAPVAPGAAGAAGAAIESREPSGSHLMSTYRPAPVRFVSGRGCRLRDDRGREYLDFLSGIAVTSLGHAHPGVADAIAAQARELLHVSNLFENALAEGVAATLDVLIGDGTALGGKVFFANSGAEANEAAIKLARRFGGRGRHEVVSALGSFHGRTLATLHATGQPSKHEAFAPLPEGFRHVAYGDLAALETAADPTRVAAVLLEPIEGEIGVVVPPPGYLAAVRALCDDRGILLVLDEIQTGLGRTGRWFAFQQEGIVPDVVTMAKALGNGVPAGACWARAAVADCFAPGDHGSTFGGQPLALSAVRATLDTMIALDVPSRARERGAQLATSLRAVPGVREVRGRGLLLGVVLDAGIDAPTVVSRALEAGLVVNAAAPDVVRLAPPLVVTAAECEEAVSVLRSVVAEVAAGRGGAGTGGTAPSADGPHGAGASVAEGRRP
ncbi:MAG TPA: acetylornithine transaminase [Acidimicrobiales bacterium]|nr:acetylornithine transaminase [Acidimicrobiales bacterium]